MNMPNETQLRKHAPPASATNGSSSGTYTYDGNGLRIQKISGSTTTVYIFSGSKVIAEYVNGTAPASPTREYIYSGAALIAKIESGATNYYHQDHLSNRLLTNSSGTTVEQIGHFPFGESWYNASNDKLAFTSYERDAESGNDYAMARYYISRLARFASADRHSGDLGNPQSLNRYVYALDNPGILVDPTGMDPCLLMYDARHQKRRRLLEIHGGGPIDAAVYTDPFASQSPDDGCDFGDLGGGTVDIPLNDNPCAFDFCIQSTSTDGTPPGVDSSGPSAPPDPGDDFGPIIDPGILSSQVGNGILGAVTGTVKKAYCKYTPSGRSTSITVAAGGIGSVSGSIDTVVNYNSGQTSLFATGGGGLGWNGGGSLTATTGLVYGLDSTNNGFSGQFKGGNFYAPTPVPGLGAGGSVTHGGGITVVSAGVSGALAGKYGFGGSWTNTTQPINIGRFTGYTSADYIGYLLRRPCN